MGKLLSLPTIFVFLLVPVTSIAAQDINLTKVKPIIVDAAEDLRKLWKKSEFSPTEYQTALDISCTALRALSEDPDFANLIRNYAEKQYDETLAKSARETLLNFRSFLDFLVVERDLLLEAGLAEASVDEILAQIIKVRLEAAAFRVDANALLADLQGLAKQACSAKEQFSGHVERKEMQCNLLWIVPAVLGGIAVVVDIPLAFGPATQIVSAVSIGAGSASISAAGLVAPHC
jgi:hypothetical protein